MKSWDYQYISDLNDKVIKLLDSPSPLLVIVQYEDCLCNMLPVFKEKLNKEFTHIPKQKDYTNYVKFCNNVNDNMLEWLVSMSTYITIVSYGEIPTSAKEKIKSNINLCEFEENSNYEVKATLLKLPYSILVDHDPDFMRYNPPYIIVDRPWNKTLKGVRVNPW